MIVKFYKQTLVKIKYLNISAALQLAVIIDVSSKADGMTAMEEINIFDALEAKYKMDASIAMVACLIKLFCTPQEVYQSQYSLLDNHHVSSKHHCLKFRWKSTTFVFAPIMLWLWF